MRSHTHPVTLIRRLALVAALAFVALLGWSALTSSAQAAVCLNGNGISGGVGPSAYYLYACSGAAPGGLRPYALFHSGPTSTRASQCQVYIRPVGGSAEFFDCTGVLRKGYEVAYYYSRVTRARTQACYRFKYGSAPWAPSRCVTSD
jgi:hypothetical protein